MDYQKNEINNMPLENENLLKAGEMSDLSFYEQLSGKRIFFKRVSRKLLGLFYGWFFIPLIERQSKFNNKMVDSLKEFFAINLIHQTSINEIEDRNNILTMSINDFENKVLELEEKINYFTRNVAPEHRLEAGKNRSILIPAMNDNRIAEKVNEIQSASENEMINKINLAKEQYKHEINQKMLRYKNNKETIIIFGQRFYNERGMEANKNEAYDLFKLLQKNSLYDVKLISLEIESKELNYNDSIICVDKGNFEECIKTINPKLIVLYESTPYITFDLNRGFNKYRVLLRLTAQNPLQGLSEKAIEELRHCNDYGMHQYIVCSENALNIMERAGFRDVVLNYPIINVDRYKVNHNREHDERPFTIGFASSPMGEEQYDDRGIYLLAQVIQKLPEINFKILWRNGDLAIPSELLTMDNCKIETGKYDMSLFYNEVDGVIIPYKSINFNHACSLSGIESMLLGIPVIATNVSGISDIIKEFKMGIICEPDDISLIDGIQNLINDYDNFSKDYNMTFLRRAFHSNKIVSTVEEAADKYFPHNFVSLEEWNHYLNKKDKYLVKGHEAIKEYYQKLEIAEDYNAERFLQFPFNCYDAFERASIDIALENISNDHEIKILDIASGDGRIVQENIKYGYCTSVDSSPAMLNIVQRKYGYTQKVKTIICDFFVDELKEKHDVITTFRYIRHYDYIQRVVIYKKIWDNLNENGILVFDAPNIRYTMNEREGENWGYYNIYDVFWTEETIVNELSHNHFAVKYLIPICLGNSNTEPVSWTVVAIKDKIGFEY